MRITTIAAVFLFAGVFGLDAAVPAFSEMDGNYPDRGSVRVKQGGARVATGRLRIQFRSDAKSERAALSLNGTLRLHGRLHGFTETIVFRDIPAEDTEAPIQAVTLSNLAPALDDGKRAEGTFTAVGLRRLTADVPFLFRSAVGRVSLTVFVKNVAGTRRITVIQTLQSDALMEPVTWRFQASAARR